MEYCGKKIKKVTLQDIAAAAGVSVSTVHRALKGKMDISKSSSKKIKEAADKLGYRYKPCNPDRQLQENPKINVKLKSHTVGLLLVDKPLSLLKYRINIRLLAHLESILARHGLLMSIHQLSDSPQLPAAVSSERLDGVIITGYLSNPKMISALKNMNAVGVFSSPESGCEWDWVAPGYEVRGRMAADYLFKRGHSRIGYFNPEPEHAGFEMVGNAFVRRAKAKGLQAKEYRYNVAAAGPRRFSRQEIIDKMIHEIVSLYPSERPTALHIVNDLTACEVYKSLQLRGFRPMEDMDIIACDNDDMLLSEMFPRPATFDLNLECIAEMIVESLMCAIGNSGNHRIGARIFVSPCLVESAHQPACDFSGNKRHSELCLKSEKDLFKVI